MPVKLVIKGAYRGEEQLPTAHLPENAVPYLEPDDPAALNRAACRFLLPCFLLAVVIVLLKLFSPSGFTFHIGGIFLGILLFFPLIPLHELLHAICFPRDAVVELYYSLKDMLVFVVSVAPISKRRFIWMSLFPNLLLGLVPLLIFLFLPLHSFAGSLLFGLGLYGLSVGVGDYLNAWNTLRQVPKGAMTVLSGFHSYWYLP